MGRTLCPIWKRAATTTTSHNRGGTETAGQIQGRGEGVDVETIWFLGAVMVGLTTLARLLLYFLSIGGTAN